MLTIDDYMTRAKDRNGLSSDRQLSAALGISGPTTNFWKSRRTWPSDEVMVRLARLAGEDEQIALLHLSSWRTTGQTATMYLDLARKISAMAVTLFLLFSILPASQSHAAPLSGNSGISVYYGK